MVQTIVSRGKAVITADGLRCNAPRVADSSRICNKLLVKANQLGQIAGNFRCDRCKSEVEVRVVRA
jgi:transcription initiation factor IIE alpha subunit